MRRLWAKAKKPDDPGRLTRWLFLRVLGVVYFCAFASLWGQVRGLLGEHGLLPAADYLHAVGRETGPARVWLVPTLAWLDPSARGLEWLCGAGTGLSLLLIAGVLPIPVLALLWLLSLSLVNVGQDFLGFQWDALLLETGFLAIFYAPGQALPRWSREAPPSRAIVWLLRWLLFRLMFSSGVVKLSSGDPNWRRLTALAFHYETQPLPTPLAWFLFHWPLWLQKLSTGAVLAIELAAPFLIFGPRRSRLVAAGLLAGLQVAILLTGNYAFFNLLTLALCATLLDDAALRRCVPARWRGRLAEPERRPSPSRFRRRLVVPVAALLLFLSLLEFGSQLAPGVLPEPVQAGLARVEPFHLVSTYGLFAVMTTSRPEIIVEGSQDGRTWLPYGFRYQPDALDRAPRWVAPYQPRLDWQMWFAALSPPPGPYWFSRLLLRLLQGSPDVLALLATNPFPHGPPRYVRAVRYDYRFTDAAARARGIWWRRAPQGLYFPPVSLRPARTSDISSEHPGA